MEKAKRESKLAVASVSGVAGPWVRWAILIQGSERSPAPLAHKPLYRSPHRVLKDSRDCVCVRGGCYPSVTSVREDEDTEPSRRWGSMWVSAVEMSKSSLTSLRTWSPEPDNRCPSACRKNSGKLFISY